MCRKGVPLCAIISAAWHRAGALGVALLIVGIGGAASVSADPRPRASPRRHIKRSAARTAISPASRPGSMAACPLTCRIATGAAAQPSRWAIRSLSPDTSVGSTPGYADDIDPLAYQKLGCTNGDLNCFYARLNGSVPITTPYCDGNGCTSVPPNDSILHDHGLCHPLLPLLRDRAGLVTGKERDTRRAQLPLSRAISVPRPDMGGGHFLWRRARARDGRRVNR